MDYKTQKDFINALKTGALSNHVKLITWAWFYLRKDGWVAIDFDARIPMISDLFSLERNKKVHPSFAWGIYQLMSNLNTK